MIREREGLSDTSDNGMVRLTTKELLAELSKRIEDMHRALMDEIKDHHDRLSRLELRVPQSEDLRDSHYQLKRDFEGAMRRIDQHINSEGHGEGIRRLGIIEAEHRALMVDREVHQRLEQHMKDGRVRGQWLIGIGVTILLGILGILVRLWG